MCGLFQRLTRKVLSSIIFRMYDHRFRELAQTVVSGAKITASEAEVPRGGSVNKEGNECHGR